MNAAPDCRDCRAWDEQPDDLARGVCRRRPPAVELLVVPGGDGRDAVQTLTVWPVTAAEGDGCFEHLPLPPQPPARDPARERALRGRDDDR